MVDVQSLAGYDRRAALRAPLHLDPYLTEVAERFPSHKFLGGATQGVYKAQIALLKDYAERFYGNIGDLRVLDWGAGKGHISYLLRKEGFNVTSCDLVSDSIDSAFAQETPIISDSRIDVVELTHDVDLPFPDRQFDIVVGFGVLEHVNHDLASLHEIRRVLKEGGSFFFSFLPYYMSWSQRLAHMRGDFYHSRLYSLKTITDLAQSAGFKAGPIWHGQFLPKNGLPYRPEIEAIDRVLTDFLPVKYFATNLEGFLIAE